MVQLRLFYVRDSTSFVWSFVLGHWSFLTSLLSSAGSVSSFPLSRSWFVRLGRFPAGERVASEASGEGALSCRNSDRFQYTLQKPNRFPGVHHHYENERCEYLVVLTKTVVPDRNQLCRDGFGHLVRFPADALTVKVEDKMINVGCCLRNLGP